jgi:membrane protein DedA with SNARE-associated domain
MRPLVFATAIFCGKFIQFLVCALITIFYGPEIARTAHRAVHEHFGVVLAIGSALGVVLLVYVLRKLFARGGGAKFPIEEAEGEAVEDVDSTLIS